MKVNTSSWHFNVMALYKWARATASDFDDIRRMKFRSWSYNKDYRVELEDFNDYKSFMIETGHMPLDFCTYWRNVLVWPLAFVLYWLVGIAACVFALSHVTFVGSAILAAVVVLVLVIFAVIGLIGYVATRIKEKIKEDREDGFFKNVNKAVKNSEFCTLMEYDTKKEASND